MFWQFTPHTTQVDTLLDKEDLSLTEILDEDSVYQELKIIQNKKLINFLIKPDNLMALVDLIATEPPDDAPETVKYKYPNVACELLTSDMTEINDALVGVEEDEDLHDRYLDRLYAFLQSPPPLNPLSASFFMKVMSGLIARKSDRVVSYLRSKNDFLNRVLVHLGTSAIMDLLLKMVQQIPSEKVKADVAMWLNSERLIHRLVEGLNPEESEEKHCYTALCLSELISIYREEVAQAEDTSMPVSADITCLLDTAESVEIMTELVNRLASKEAKTSVIVNCLVVFETIMNRKKNENPMADPNPLICGPPIDLKRVARASKHLADSLLPRLPEIHALLHNPPTQEYSIMPTTISVLSPPLGNCRLQIIRLVHALIALNSATVNSALAKERILFTILDLFTQYPWNTFLHRAVQEIVSTIIVTEQMENSPASGEGEPALSLLEQLVVECRFVKRLIDWSTHNSCVAQKAPGGRRCGYMGHVTRMFNVFNDNWKSGPNAKLLKAFCLEVNEEWETITDNALADVNAKSKIEMPNESSGGFLPSTSDDEEFRDIIFPSASGGTFGQIYGFAEDGTNAEDSTDKMDDYFSSKISSSVDLGMGLTSNLMHNSEDSNFGSPRFRLTLSGLRGRRTSAEEAEGSCPPPLRSASDDDDEEDDMWVEKHLTNQEEGEVESKPTAVHARLTAVGGAMSDEDEDEEEEEENFAAFMKASQRDSLENMLPGKNWVDSENSFPPHGALGDDERESESDEDEDLPSPVVVKQDKTNSPANRYLVEDHVTQSSPKCLVMPKDSSEEVLFSSQDGDTLPFSPEGLVFSALNSSSPPANRQDSMDVDVVPPCSNGPEPEPSPSAPVKITSSEAVDPVAMETAHDEGDAWPKISSIDHAQGSVPGVTVEQNCSDNKALQLSNRSTEAARPVLATVGVSSCSSQSPSTAVEASDHEEMDTSDEIVKEIPSVIEAPTSPWHRYAESPPTRDYSHNLILGAQECEQVVLDTDCFLPCKGGAAAVSPVAVVERRDDGLGKKKSSEYQNGPSGVDHE